MGVIAAAMVVIAGVEGVSIVIGSASVRVDMNQLVTL